MTRGALWIVFAMALIAVSDNFTRLVTDQISLWQFHAWRSAMVLPVALAFVWATGRLGAVRPRSPRRVAERSLFATAAMLLYFAALPAVGIAQAAAGLFTSPIWVVLVSALFFGEKAGPRRIAAVAIGFAGACLALGVGAEPLRPMSLAAVAGGLGWALSVVWTRRHCLGETPSCLAIWQFAALLLAGLAGLALLPWIAPLFAGVEGAEFVTRASGDLTLPVLLILFLIGLARITAAGCQAIGYQSGDSSVLGVFDLSFLFWAPFVAWALWDEAIPLRTAAGMALIVAAGALAIWPARAARAGA